MLAGIPAGRRARFPVRFSALGTCSTSGVRFWGMVDHTPSVSPHCQDTLHDSGDAANLVMEMALLATITTMDDNDDTMT